MEQVIIVEKSLTAASSKIKLLEEEIDQIRVKHRSTPEVALIQELAKVKGQLAESDRQIERIKSEKAEIALQKEQFRASVNKLASRTISSHSNIVSLFVYLRKVVICFFFMQ